MILNVFLVILLSYGSFSYNEGKLRLTDLNNSTNNYLFRGAFPGTTAEFEYSVVKEAMINLAHSLNITDFPLDFYMMDISLMHPKEDEKYLKIESEFFKAKPELGELINWEIHGTDLNASKMAKWEREPLLKEFNIWDRDDLPSRMEKVYKYLNTQYEQPRVIYVHWSGVDRTGEFSGSYYMQYLDWSFKKAYAYDNEVKGSLISHTRAYMMNWYCYYMEWKLKRHFDCDHWF